MKAMYQAQVVNVCNNYQGETSYLPLAVEIAKNSQTVVTIFDADGNLVYSNDRLGSLSGARRREIRNLDAMRIYLARVYIDVESFYQAVARTFEDLTRREHVAETRGGTVVRFEIVPVCGGVELIGVIVFGEVLNGQSTI